MHKGWRIALAIALWGAASLVAASPPVTARFEGARTLVLDFPDSMQVWDNAVRADAVRLTPALATTCSWSSDTRLACALERPVADATRYRIDIVAELKSLAGRVPRPRVFTVETRRPELSAMIAEWKDGVPSVVVTANMAVDATDAGAALRLRIDGQPAPVALRRLPPAWKNDESFRFALSVPATTDATIAHTLALEVVPGLRSPSGPLPGVQAKQLLRARLREPFALRSAGCGSREGQEWKAPHDGLVELTCMPEEPVMLEFSRPLPPDAVKWLATQLPAGMRADEGWRHYVASEVDRERPPTINLLTLALNSRLELMLGADIRAADGTPLSPTTLRIRAGSPRPQVRASHAKGLVADPRAAQPLLEALNLRAASATVDGLAQTPARETIELGAQARDRAIGVESTVATRALEEGGWVRWTITGQREGRAASPTGVVEFAAPAFDLMAVAGRREVLAWANAWDHDAPVAGAELELLWRDGDTAEPRVAARGRTGADGTVSLRLPDDLVITPPEGDDRWSWTGPSWYLRAVDGEGGGRAVLPLEATSRYGHGLGLAAPRKTWGVSDRPLYHAGDTVHYRLWQREQGPQQSLRAPADAAPVQLSLVDSERDKTILEWPATRDAEGGISGELVLPVHLVDATYCIGVKGSYGDTDGSCFFVGTYRAQDLWVTAKPRGGLLRDGDRFVADIRAGYFSGGPAAGADADALAVTLWPLRFDVAYPQFDGYTFVDVNDDETETPELEGVPDEVSLDDEGGLHLDLPVVFDKGAEQRPAFGMLALEAQVSPEGREGTVASDESTRYARYDRYVGLRTTPAWFDSRDRVQVQAVLAGADGKLLAGRIDVTVEYLSGSMSDPESETVAHCAVASGAAAACDFPRRLSGVYRLTARSGDAAPAVLQRYVWVHGSDGDADVDDEPELTVEDPSPKRDVPVRVLVQHDFDRARALFVIASGGQILDRRVVPLAGHLQSVPLPVSERWRGRLHVYAYVRDATPSVVADGYRKPVEMEALDAEVPEARAETATPPVALRFVPAATRPGTRASLELRNDSARPRWVTVAVIDDALRSQAQRWLPYADPAISGFADWRSRGEGSLSETGFEEWGGQAWRLDFPWSQELTAAVPPPPEQPPVLAEDPSSVDLPAPAPPRVRDSAEPDGPATTLDRIEVTGSRIRRADILETRELKDPGKPVSPRPQSSAGSTQALVRSHFADTAWWQPQIRLAPGETRRVEIALPDNLTRWRAVAWSTDVDSDFTMADAALEVGLPVEARLQTPVRLYPGDDARVATSVRHLADQAATAQTRLQVEGADAAIEYTQDLRLAPRGQASVINRLDPQVPGTLHLIATAQTPAGHDAVAADIEVASPLLASRWTLAGWLGTDAVTLPLPALPPGAHGAHLKVEVERGTAALSRQWTDDLHRYPHRCWEQILSRAVAAALALERHDDSWPDALQVVHEAQDNAAVFQTDAGGFVYFASSREGDASASVPLTAYSVRALALLQSLGYSVAPHITEQAQQFLTRVQADGGKPDDAQRDETLFDLAFAAASQAPAKPTLLDPLWKRWNGLPLPVQVAATQAFFRAAHPAARPALKRLLKRTSRHGAARSLRLPQRYDAWMSSDLREQCALIGLLREHSDAAFAQVRSELLAGLGDLYAGGVAAVDTQTGAYCLMATRDPVDAPAAPVQVDLALGARAWAVRLDATQSQASWRTNAVTDASNLRLQAQGAHDTPLSFLARLDYAEDARDARADAIGFRLERSYAVLRDGQWQPVAQQTVKDGDWVRITLVLDTSATRYFVAVTDSVPGGLRPTDLELSGVATKELERVGNEGTRWFGTRKLDARSPRFYADRLPPGRHELHYFARVGNAGDYLAAPAQAELMYGAATHARSDATRLRIVGNVDAGG